MLDATFNRQYWAQGDPGQEGGGGDKPPGWKEGDESEGEKPTEEKPSE